MTFTKTLVPNTVKVDMNFEETVVLPGGSGRFPGEGNGYPLHYSCLENSMDRGDWRATVHGVTKRQKYLTLFFTHIQIFFFFFYKFNFVTVF